MYMTIKVLFADTQYAITNRESTYEQPLNPSTSERPAGAGRIGSNFPQIEGKLHQMGALLRTLEPQSGANGRIPVAICSQSSPSSSQSNNSSTSSSSHARARIGGKSGLPLALFFEIKAPMTARLCAVGGAKSSLELLLHNYSCARSAGSARVGMAGQGWGGEQDTNPIPFSDRSNLAGGLSLHYYAEQCRLGAALASTVGGAAQDIAGYELVGAQTGARKRGCDNGVSPAKRARTDQGQVGPDMSEPLREDQDIDTPHCPPGMWRDFRKRRSPRLAKRMKVVRRAEVFLLFGRVG